MRILIATSAVPSDRQGFNTICGLMRDEATRRGLNIPQGILWTAGPGCSNLAFDVIGDDAEAEKFSNMITMAFMPSKWTTTADPLPAVDTFSL